MSSNTNNSSNNQTNFTSIIKVDKNAYQANCKVSINSVNELKKTPTNTEIKSDVFNLKELDLEWFYIFCLAPDKIAIYLRINNCTQGVAATVQVINCYCYTTDIASVVKGLEIRLSYKDSNAYYFPMSNSSHVRDGVFNVTIKNVFTHIGVVHLNSKNAQNKKVKPILCDDHMYLNYGAIFNSKKHSDITFLIGDRKLFAHKVILLGKSAVFAAMFEHQMTEERENIVRIEDITYEVFEEMMKYIYTNNSEKLTVMATDLLAAADKCQIMNLRQICVECLEDTLSNSTVIQIIVLAYLHSLDSLKEMCLKFIMNNYSSIDNRSLIEYPQLQAEIIEYYMYNKA